MDIAAPYGAGRSIRCISHCIAVCWRRLRRMSGQLRQGSREGVMTVCFGRGAVPVGSRPRRDGCHEVSGQRAGEKLCGAGGGLARRRRHQIGVRPPQDGKFWGRIDAQALEEGRACPS